MKIHDSDLRGRLYFALLVIAMSIPFLPLAQTHLYQRQASNVEGAELFELSATPLIIALITAVWALSARRRKLTAALHEPASPLLAAGFLTLCAGLVLWSQYTGAMEIRLLGLPFAILGAGALLGGTALVRGLIIPVIFLLFAFPRPGVLTNQIIFPLQLMTAEFSAWLINVIGIPAVQFSDLIFTRKQVFQVIETCSGLRSMETLLMSALLYAELFPTRPLQRVILLLAVPFLSFFLNGIRILTIALNPEQSTHTTQGIVVLVVGILLIATLHHGLDRILPTGTRRRIRKAGSLQPQLVGLLAGFFLLLSALTFFLPSWESENSLVIPLNRFPSKLGEWNGRYNKLDNTFLGSVGYGQSISYDLKRGEEEVNLFFGIDYFRDRSLSLLSPKTVPFVSGAELIDPQIAKLGATHPKATCALTRTYPNKRFHLVCYWYEGALPLYREIFRAMYSVDQGPFRRSEATRVVRFSTPLSNHRPSEQEIDQSLERIRSVAAEYEIAIARVEAIGERERARKSKAN